MKRGALSNTLLALFALFTAQFFVGMALNLLVTLPMTIFSAKQQWICRCNFLCCNRRQPAFNKPLPHRHRHNCHCSSKFGAYHPQKQRLQSLIHCRLHSGSFHICQWRTFCRCQTSPLTQFLIRWLAGFLSAFILYFVMAMLMYRDMAVHAG